MSAIIGSVLGLIFVSITYFIAYTFYKEDKEAENKDPVYRISRSVKKGIAIFFQQMFILNSINILSCILTYLGELGTMPLMKAFFSNYIVIFLFINRAYLWFMILYLIVSFWDFFKRMFMFKKNGGRITW